LQVVAVEHLGTLGLGGLAVMEEEDLQSMSVDTLQTELVLMGLQTLEAGLVLVT
jgi:hypothetical protein